MLALATDFPTSGIDGSAQGANDKSAENAANLAIMQHQNLGSGYTLKAINYDDSLAGTGDWAGIHDPATGARNVRQLVKNPCIVGMVGPMHSDVAAAEMPIAANAGLAMISPGNTSPSLTLRPYAEAEGQKTSGYYGDQYSAGLPGMNFDQLHPPGKPINYFRVVPNDSAQFVIDAQATSILGATSVYIVNDAIPYGELLAGGFTQAFEGRGGRVVGITTVGPDAQDVLDVTSRIAAANPDAVYYGGISSRVGGLLKARLVNLGYRGLFIGSDGIADDPAFVTQAGNAADGTFASIGVRDLSTFTSGAAAQFLSDYSARYQGQTPSVLAAYSYDSAMVLITAIKQLITTQQGVTRAAVIEQVQHVQYAGVIGPISFDSNGDISHGIFSIYVVHQGQWAYAWQLSM
jgi:branched-chain amino acid transport system substrate-binding protein